MQDVESHRTLCNDQAGLSVTRLVNSATVTKISKRFDFVASVCAAQSDSVTEHNSFAAIPFKKHISKYCVLSHQS